MGRNMLKFTFEVFLGGEFLWGGGCSPLFFQDFRILCTTTCCVVRMNTVFFFSLAILLPTTYQLRVDLGTALGPFGVLLEAKKKESRGLDSSSAPPGGLDAQYCVDSSKSCAPPPGIGVPVLRTMWERKKRMLARSHQHEL